MDDQNNRNDQMDVDVDNADDLSLSQLFQTRIKDLRSGIVNSSADLFADISQNVDDASLDGSAKIFVEYFRMCLTNSPSVFSSQVDPNTFRTESEQLYSENELRVFSKWVYRVCGVFLLSNRLTVFHPEIYELMNPLFRTLKHNHSHILMESISALVGIVTKLVKKFHKPRGFLKVAFKYENLRRAISFRTPISSIPANYIWSILKVILPHLDVLNKQSSIFVPLVQSVQFLLQQGIVTAEDKLDIAFGLCQPLNIGLQQAKTALCCIIIYVMNMGLKKEISCKDAKAFLEQISTHDFSIRDSSVHCFLVEFESRLHMLILDPLFKECSSSEFQTYIIDFYRRVQIAMGANTGDANDILRKENSVAFASDIFQNLPVALPIFGDVIHKELFRVLDNNQCAYVDPASNPEMQSRTPIWSTIRDAWVAAVKDFEQLILSTEEDSLQIDKGSKLKNLMESTTGFTRLMTSILLQGESLCKLRRTPLLGGVDRFFFHEDLVDILRKLLEIQTRVPTLFDGVSTQFLQWLFVLIRELGTISRKKLDSLQSQLLYHITFPYFPMAHVELTADELKQHRGVYGQEFMEECLEALGSDLFVNYLDNSVIVDVIDAAMTNDSPSCIKGIFRLIAGVKHVCRTIAKEKLLNYIGTVTNSNIWIEDEAIGILLTKAISRIGCVLTTSTVATNTRVHHPKNGSCQVCEAGNHVYEPENCKMQEIRKWITHLIHNGSSAVHFEILDSILYLKRHGLIPDPNLVANFLEVVREPIQLKVLVKLLRNSVPLLTVHFPDYEDSETSCAMFRMVFVHVRSFLKSNGPETTIDCLVDFLDVLGLVSRECSDSLAIEIARATLMILTLNWSMSVTSQCKLVFRHLAEGRRLKACEYMGQIREHLVPDFVEMCLFQIFGLRGQFDPDEDTEMLLSKKCEVLLRAFEHTMEFRREDFTRIYIPVFLCQALPLAVIDRRARIFISTMAHFSLVNTKELLETYFPVYIPAIGLGCATASDFSGIIQFLMQQGLSPGILASLMCQALMNETLSYFSVDKERVKRLLSSLLSSQSTSRPSLPTITNLASDLAIAQFISERLMGFVVYLDCKMDSRFENVTIKRRLFNSLVELIPYLGTSISGMKMRIAKLLNSCTKKQYLLDLLAKAWKAYTENLDDSVLPSMMNEILASVTHLKSLPNVNIGQTLEEIAYYIIAEKNRLTREFRHQVYYIQQHIQCRQTLSMLRNGNYSGVKFLEYLIESLRNGNVHIRHQASLGVQQIVKYENPSVDLKELLEDSQFVHPSVCRLILALLECIQSQDKELSYMAVQVIGELGAVDYYRMNVRSTERQSRRDVANIFPTGVAFAHSYIDMLRKQYQGTELSLPSDIDICAYAVQEVLRIYRVGEQNSGHPIWSTLPAETKSVFSPLISSKFALRDVVPLQTYPCPLYGSEHGRRFQQWCTNFAIQMYTIVTSNPAKEIFRVTLPLMVRSLPVALYLLPYIALFAALDGSPAERRTIYKELRRICKLWFDRGENISDVTSATIQHPFDDDSHFDDPPTDDAAVADRLSVTNAVFSIIDIVSFVARYGASNFEILNSIATTGGTGHSSSPLSGVTGNGLTTVKLKACRSILPDPIHVAKAAFQTQCYQRALLNLEEHLFYFPEKTQDNLGFLQRIFVALEDTDGVIGVSAIRKGKPSIYEEALELLATAKKEDAASKFQLMIQKGFSDLESENVLTQAYLSIERPEMALTVMNGLELGRRVDVRSSPLDDCRIEACWKLQRWGDLATQLKGTRVDLSSRGCLMHAAILSLFQRKRYSAVLDIVGQAREKCLQSLRSADTSIGSYHSRYAEITRLHIFCEIEQAVELMKSDGDSVKEEEFPAYKLKVTNLLQRWKARLDLAQKSLSTVEPIVNTRKALLNIMKDNGKRHSINRLFSSALRDCCLAVAKLEIRAKNFGRANACIQEARQFRSPEVFIQDAKFVAQRGDMDRGIRIINDCMKQYFSGAKIRAWEALGVDADLDPEQVLCAKALLLLAKFNDEKCNVDMDVNIKNYLQVTEVHKKSEKNFFHLANYCDTIVNSSSHQNRHTEMQEFVVRYYCKSLEYGSKHVYQSLPRLLFVWLTYASSPPSKTSPKEVIDLYTKTVAAMSSNVAKLYNTAPRYIFLTVYSQLISRICHPHPRIWVQLKDMMAGIVVSYPHQTLWMMMAVSKSTHNMRKSRCTELLRAVEEKAPGLKTLINDYSVLAGHLIELCTTPSSTDTRTASIETLAPALVRLLKKPHFSPILMPHQQFLTVTISRVGNRHATHKPFQQFPVFIQSIEKHVQIMPSLQRPKRIALRGNDGRVYMIMCKPVDDLRKDSKVMEMHNIVNWYLRKNPEARERNLYVRTYAVIALTEDAGLLEWVPNLQGLRPLLQKIYRDKDLILSQKEVIALYRGNGASSQAKLQGFTKLVNLHPPVLREWFLINFSDPQEWYTARCTYIRTCAVMSMVGYLIGLGDRHGENILLDSICGDVVHVDYNCLFNLGEGLEVPEVVPFRLTHNMVNAMGALGSDGPFRRACEITVGVLRQNSAVFMSVLRPFVFDPLVEWARTKGSSSNHAAASSTSTTGEVVNVLALQNIQAIQLRLDGVARNKTKELNVPLSVEAQVSYLIKEATAPTNLCQMYVGWSSYL